MKCYSRDKFIIVGREIVKNMKKTRLHVTSSDRLFVRWQDGMGFEQWDVKW